ncbi:MAG: alpha/beta hydrolase [Microbacteriaceae bacterium]|nr:alpha/beta hydrolase [Microbacteriaceae bacterium]
MLPAPHAAMLAAIPVTEHRAVVGGADTAWWIYGPPAEEAKATIFAIHGYRGDHHGLEPVIARLPEFRIISPDLPGFGESGPLPGRHTIQAYTDWLVAVAERMPRPFTALGHSFGTILTAAALDAAPGPAGVRFAPERTILMNPIAGPALKGAKAFGTLSAAAWYKLAGLLPERAGRSALSARFMVDGMTALTAKTRDPQLRQWIKEEHRRYFNGFHSTRSVIEGFDASVSDHIAAHASAFTMPTLLIAAVQDQIASISAVRRLHEQIPGSELVEYDGVGHLIHYERAQEAADAIRGFHP